MTWAIIGGIVLAMFLVSLPTLLWGISDKHGYYISTNRHVFFANSGEDSYFNYIYHDGNCLELYSIGRDGFVLHGFIYKESNSQWVLDRLVYKEKTNVKVHIETDTLNIESPRQGDPLEPLTLQRIRNPFTLLRIKYNEEFYMAHP